MAINENGNELDSGGNVRVDHVWGNLPMQPNDVRVENGGEVLNPALDNHVIAYEKWNGYPLYTPEADGGELGSEGPEGAGFIPVPNVLGLLTANATDILEDAGLVVSPQSAATNAAKDVTRFNATSATAATVYTTSASTAYPVGTVITLRAGTPAGSDPVNLPNYALGDWKVTAATSTTLTIVGSGFTVADTTGINATGNIIGKVGTIKVQSPVAGTDEVEVGDTVQITAFAAAS